MLFPIEKIEIFAKIRVQILKYCQVFKFGLKLKQPFPKWSFGCRASVSYIGDPAVLLGTGTRTIFR